MSFLDQNLDDAVEPSAAEAGEHKVRLILVNEGTDKNGHAYVQPRFEVPEIPESKDFTDFMHLPDDGWMNDKQLNNSRFKMRTFFGALGIDYSVPVVWAELGGEEGWAILGLGDSDEYGEQNYIRKYVVPA